MVPTRRASSCPVFCGANRRVASRSARSRLSDVLRGKSTPKVQQFGHDSVSTFGIGADLDVMQWRSVIRQLVMMRLVRVDHERFNTLRLTEASREVLRGEKQLRLRRPAKTAPKRSERRLVDKTRVDAEVADLAGVDENVYEALRACAVRCRRSTASRHTRCFTTARCASSPGYDRSRSTSCARSRGSVRRSSSGMVRRCSRRSERADADRALSTRTPTTSAASAH